MRRLPGPATLYERPVPVTLQFATVTWNSLRANAPACKSAAYVHRILRILLVGTVCPSRSVSDAKFSDTLHLVGDVPFASVRDAASHNAVPDPDVYEYTPNRLPFAPVVLAAIDAPAV